MNVILTGGGTAGHVHPAVAIAEIIKEHEPNSRILFIGRKDGKENRAVIGAGIELETLEVSGLSRRMTAKNIKSIFLALKARSDAEKIIKRFAPDVIIGTGGYVCYPVIKAGQGMKIKTVIHESNAVAGLAARMLSKRCDKVLLNYKSAEQRLKRKDNILVTGNPLRKDFDLISRQKARTLLGIRTGELLIVSFGGSIGAEKLNETCIRLMKEYCEKNKRIRHIHALGERFYDECNEEELKSGKNGCRLLSYIDNMPTLLSAADIAITRAGALTLSELARAEVASILVPSPNVTDDHQFKNAKELSDSGAAITVPESERLYEELLFAARSLCEDSDNRLRLRKRIRAFSKKDAGEKIYLELKKLI